MSRESGSEHGQRTVADLLAQYGGSGDAGPRRRRRRAEDDENSAPRTIIQRVLSDSGQLLPIRDEPGGHRPGQHPQPGQPPGQQPGRPNPQSGNHAQRPGAPGTGRRPAPAPAPGPPTGRAPAPAPAQQPGTKPPTPQPPTPQPPQPTQQQPALQQHTPSRPTEIRPAEARGDHGATAYARPVSPPTGQQPQPKPSTAQSPTGKPPAGSSGPTGQSAPSTQSRPSAPAGGPASWPADASVGPRPTAPAGRPPGGPNPLNPPSRPVVSPPSSQQHPPSQSSQTRTGQPPAGRPDPAATEIRPQVEDGYPDQAAYPGEDSDEYPGRRPEASIAAALGPARPEPLTQEFPPMPDRPPAPTGSEPRLSEQTRLNRPPLRGRPPGPPPPAESTQAHPGPYYDEDANYPADFPDHDLDVGSGSPAGDIGRRLAGEDEPPDEDGFFGQPENRLADDPADRDRRAFDSFGDHDEHGEHDDLAEPDEDEPERSTARQWLTMIAQVGVGAIGGAAVFLGFSWLWGKTPGVALAAALVVIVGLVLVVRKLRRAEDLQTTLLAILAGLVVTVSPAALLLLRK